MDIDERADIRRRARREIVADGAQVLPGLLQRYLETLDLVFQEMVRETVLDDLGRIAPQQVSLPDGNPTRYTDAVQQQAHLWRSEARKR